MAGWLRRDEEPVIKPRAGIEDVMPRSVRGPEAQRFERLDDVDEHDPDVEFVAALARSLSSGRQAADAQAPTDDPVDEAAQLAAFREYAATRLVTRVNAFPLQVRPIAIDELVEDLQTTAAALRRKKAA
jgi:hypothetical protein